MKKQLRKISEQVVNEIGKMNRDQLYQFIQHCKSLTTTNCWWVEYEMKDLLISIAENERDLKAAEQKRAADSPKAGAKSAVSRVRKSKVIRPAKSG